MIEFALVVVCCYLIAGACFAIPFVLRGVNRVDAAAQSAPIGFRLLILPGTIALWPVMLAKWLVARDLGKESK